MGRRVSILFEKPTNTIATGGGTCYIVQTLAGVLYLAYIDSSSLPGFRKSTDGGITWGAEVRLATVNAAIALSVWYDRWSDIAAGLIHVAWTESTSDDTHYRTIDTESSDALSTETTIFAGGTTAAGGALSIARARGGNVYCRTTIDAGVEGGFFRLPNANVPNGAWDAARTIDETLATTDQFILVPGFAADNQDMMMMFWDASANEISRKVYDDSANSWAETSIATGMTDTSAASSFPHWAAAVDVANSRIIMAAWSAVDTANADLRCWTVTESAITETSANVVLNSTDDQGLCAVGLNTVTGYWMVAYCGKSDGSETFPTAVNQYYKISTDSGATWGAEEALTPSEAVSDQRWLVGIPRFTGSWVVAGIPTRTGGFVADGTVSVDLAVPRATSLAGIM